MVKPKLKYCGNHSAYDVDTVLRSNGDYIGFVFAESKRKVSHLELSNWLKNRNELGDKKTVALFVNAKADEIAKEIQGLPINIVQCHGSETVEEVKEIKSRLQLPIWKVIHHEAEAWKRMKDYSKYVSGFVIDSKVKGMWGGSGKAFNWEHIPKYIEEGKKLGVPVFIAGGVTKDNISELLPYNPDGIDISSGIEVAGKKCLDTIKQIEKRIEQYDNEFSR